MFQRCIQNLGGRHKEGWQGVTSVPLPSHGVTTQHHTSFSEVGEFQVTSITYYGVLGCMVTWI